jgi:hypothetical protein
VAGWLGFDFQQKQEFLGEFIIKSHKTDFVSFAPSVYLQTSERIFITFYIEEVTEIC